MWALKILNRVVARTGAPTSQQRAVVFHWAAAGPGMHKGEGWQDGRRRRVRKQED
jgi:hypothetical protein